MVENEDPTGHYPCLGTYASVDRAELVMDQLHTNPVNSEARSQ